MLAQDRMRKSQKDLRSSQVDKTLSEAKEPEQIYRQIKRLSEVKGWVSLKRNELLCDGQP